MEVAIIDINVYEAEYSDNSTYVLLNLSSSKKEYDFLLPFWEFELS